GLPCRNRRPPTRAFGPAMAEGNLPPSSPAPQTPDQQPATAAPAPPPKRRRRRRWPIVLLVLLLLLIGLVVLAPTLAGTGPGRSIILGQVNKRLHRRVDGAAWAL